MVWLAWNPVVAAPAIRTGLRGTVSLSPARPGPQQAGMPNTAPMAGALVRVRDARGREVARIRVDDEGQFVLLVAPGAYEISVDVQNAVFPRCSAIHAQVHQHKLTDVQVVCDSGMR